MRAKIKSNALMITVMTDGLQRYAMISHQRNPVLITVIEERLVLKGGKLCWNWFKNQNTVQK